jgi:hypothetical protein
MKTLNPVMIRALRQAARSELSGVINDPSIRALLKRGHIEPLRPTGASRGCLTINWKLTRAGREGLALASSSSAVALG